MEERTNFNDIQNIKRKKRRSLLRKGNSHQKFIFTNFTIKERIPIKKTRVLKINFLTHERIIS